MAADELSRLGGFIEITLYMRSVGYVLLRNVPLRT